MGEFSVNIVGLSNNAHEFKFSIGKSFFEEFGKELLTDGNFEASVMLNKHDTFIEGLFRIVGTAQLSCDRSLELFDYPVSSKHKILFKFGEVESEISDDIVIIPYDKQSLNLGQYLYEFIGLSLPMKRIHPKFQNENEQESSGIVYSSGPIENADEVIDPRWEMLKKIKK